MPKHPLRTVCASLLLAIPVVAQQPAPEPINLTVLHQIKSQAFQHSQVMDTHHSNMDLYDRVQPGDVMQGAAIEAWFVYNTATRAVEAGVHSSARQV